MVAVTTKVTSVTRVVERKEVHSDQLTQTLLNFGTPGTTTFSFRAVT